MGLHRIIQLNCDNKGCDSIIMEEATLTQSVRTDGWFTLNWDTPTPEPPDSPESYLEMIQGGPPEEEEMPKYACSRACAMAILDTFDSISE